MTQEATNPDTGKQIVVDDLQAAQHGLFTVNVRYITTAFLLNLVKFIGGSFKDYVVVYVIALLPTLIGAAPAPSIATLTQTTISLGMLLNSLLGLAALAEGWFNIVGLRNRVVDLYDALVACQKAPPNGTEASGTAAPPVDISDTKADTKAGMKKVDAKQASTELL